MVNPSRFRVEAFTFLPFFPFVNPPIRGLHLMRGGFMRIILRILAFGLWFGIAGTFVFFWRFVHHGDFRMLMASGVFGLMTVLGWGLTIGVGPFAAIQLWRLRESGRKASLLVAGYTFLYYIVSGFFFRGPIASIPNILLVLGSKATIVAILLLPSARGVCRQSIGWIDLRSNGDRNP